MARTPVHGTILAVMVGSFCGHCSENPVKKYPDSKAVLTAIKSGEVNLDCPNRALRAAKSSIRKIANPGVPYEFYVILDSAEEYTVMVESDHLVLLCAGFGGGAAHDFSITSESGKAVLKFQFETGSGVTYIYDCQYILGSRVVSSKARPWQP